MTYLAAASSALRPALGGPSRPAELLGLTRGALYLRICEPPGAFVVLSRDSVRLPCGLMLASSSAELPLTTLAPPGTAGFVVGDGGVSWSAPAGPVAVRAVREWAPARPARGQVSAAALAAVRSELHRSGLGDVGVDTCLLADLGAAAGDHAASAAVVARMLGLGPGLTPSGDDVLAGFLAGATAFGLAAAPLREAITELTPGRTTALSAALLWHAARGECIDEVAALAAVMTNPDQSSTRPPEIILGWLLTGARAPVNSQPRTGQALRRLLSVGHSSGAALALGIVTAAETALAPQQGRAA